MIKKIIAEVEKHNIKVTQDRQLSAYKAFEASEADVVICKKGTEIFLADSETIAITSNEKIWTGLQVKTGSIRASQNPAIQYCQASGYDPKLGLVCVCVDDDSDTLFFKFANKVNEYCTAGNLTIPLTPKYQNKIAAIKKLRANHQITFADLPAKLFALYDRHAQAGTLMSWRDANACAAKGNSTHSKVNSLTFVCFVCAASTCCVFPLVLIICPRS